MKSSHGHNYEIEYRPDIDGLRAFAVLSAVFYHAFPENIRGGFFGVDVFFVISGFLISSLIFTGLSQGTFSAWSFYARRIKRLFPALLTVMGACLVLGWFLLLPDEYRRLGAHVLSSLGFVQNFRLWTEGGYFDFDAKLKPLLHLWSLGVEEQFYLVWPLLAVFLFGRRPKVAMILISVGIGFSLAADLELVRMERFSTAFYLPFSRLWELLTGCLLAYVASFRPVWLDAVFRRVPRDFGSVCGMILLLAAVILLDDSGGAPGWRALVPTTGALLLIAAGPQAFFNRWVLRRPAVVFVGLISYPLYLWHWVLLSFAAIDNRESTLLNLTLVSISVVLAALTYLLIERPLRALPVRKVTAPLVALACGIAGVGFVISQQQGWAFRFPGSFGESVRLAEIEKYQYDYFKEARVTRCWLGDAKDDPVPFAEECLERAPAHQPLVVLWGDSHGGNLYPGLRNIQARRKDFRIAQYTRDTCPPFIGGYADITPTCREGNARVLETIRTEKPAMVVLFACWNVFADVPKALGETAKALHEAGVHSVFVIGPAPQWDPSLPRVMYHALRNTPPGQEVASRLSADLMRPGVREMDGDLRKAVPSMGMTYISALDAFCNEQGCLYRVDEHPDSFTTWDYGHLTARGAEYLAERLRYPSQ